MPLGEVAKMRPPMTEAAEEARDVWNAMGGEWKPEALPVLVAMLDVQHVDGLLERLMAIRAGVREIQDDRLGDRQGQHP